MVKTTVNAKLSIENLRKGMKFRLKGGKGVDFASVDCCCRICEVLSEFKNNMLHA